MPGVCVGGPSSSRTALPERLLIAQKLKEFTVGSAFQERGEEHSALFPRSYCTNSTSIWLNSCIGIDAATSTHSCLRCRAFKKQIVAVHFSSCSFEPQTLTLVSSVQFLFHLLSSPHLLPNTIHILPLNDCVRWLSPTPNDGSSPILPLDRKN